MRGRGGDAWALVRDRRVEIPAPLQAAAERAATRGQAAIFLVEEAEDASRARALAVFVVADVIRPESREAVKALREQRIKVVMLTGDAKAVAHAVATELGIDQVFAEVLPDQKVGKIQELQQTGEFPEILGPLAEGDYERALEWLLGEVAEGEADRRDRVREVMVAVFQELGQEHPLSTAYRRRLATALY